MTFTPPEPPQQPTPPPPGNTAPPAPPTPPVGQPQPATYTAPPAPGAPNPYAAPGQQPYTAPAQTEGLAIGALIAGIVFWPVGIVLSLLAMSKIKKTGNGGRGFALAGLILSILGFLGTIIGIIAIVIAAAATTAAIDDAVDSYESGSMGGDVTQSVTLNETGVTANGIGYTVSAVECGIPSVGGSGTVTEADGQFCKVSLNVVNNDTEPFTYLSSYSAAYVGETEYAPSDEASIYSDEEVVIIEDINPGSSIDTVIYYDIPVDATITRLTFTETYASDIIEVTP